jgi:arylsulfatase
VLLVTCDTLRADRLGCYGYTRDVTPELDALARESLRFESAWSTASLTVPALSALLTGRMPEEVGARAGNQVVLPAAATTLAEVLSAQGFATAAVVSNWVLRSQGGGDGFEQGFDVFDDAMTEPELGRAEVLERVAAGTTDAALAWLEERPDDRFFLWVHYQDPHGPYTAPARWVDAWSGPLGEEPELPVGKRQSGKGELPRYQVLGDLRHPDAYRQRYDAEIAYFDHELGRLLAGLDELGLGERALVVFTSDHGEALGERGYWFSHGQHVHAELVRVPLLIRTPERVARSETRVAGHVDLWPTILGALGVPAPPSRGVDLLAGATDPERLVAQKGGGWFGLASGTERLLTRRGQPMLFELATSPGEEEDLAAARPARVRALLERYQAQLETLPALELEGAARARDAASAEALDKLGYGGE